MRLQQHQRRRHRRAGRRDESVASTARQQPVSRQLRDAERAIDRIDRTLRESGR